MKFKNPIQERRERKAEEKRRKEAEEKKKQKRLLMISAGVLAAILLICGIGSLFENSDSTIQDTSSQVESVASSSTADLTTEPEETQPPETEQPEETPKPTESETPAPQVTAPVIDLSSIPAFSGDPYVVINDNVPEFTDADLTTTSFETYSSLDSLGRCDAYGGAWLHRSGETLWLAHCQI